MSPCMCPQVLALEVVLADGSLRTFTRESDPHHFHALQASQHACMDLIPQIRFTKRTIAAKQSKHTYNRALLVEPSRRIKWAFGGQSAACLNKLRSTQCAKGALTDSVDAGG